MPIGRIELQGEALFINNDNPVMKPQSALLIEVHRRYIDVHVPLDAAEIIDYTKRGR